MDIVNFPALVKRHTPISASIVDPTKDLLLIGKFQDTQFRRNGTQYESMAMTIGELLSMVPISTPIPIFDEGVQIASAATQWDFAGTGVTTTSSAAPGVPGMITVTISTGIPVGPVSELDPAISILNTPPGGPAIGDRYLVGTAPTGAWVGQSNSVAEWNGAAWVFTVPVLDDYIFITSTLFTYRFNGSAWVQVPGIALLQNGNTLGAPGVRVGTNDPNPVWIKYNNTLRVRVDGTDIRTPGSLYLGIPGMTSAATARLHVRGVGTSSLTYALKVDDSLVSEMFSIRDDGQALIRSRLTIGGSAISLVTALSVQSPAGGLSAGLVVYDSSGNTMFRLGNDGIFSFDYTGGPAMNFNVSGTTTSQFALGGGLFFHRLPNTFSWRKISDNNEVGGCAIDKWYFIKPTVGVFIPTAKVHIQGDSATNADYALKIEKSTGSLMFSIRNDSLFSAPLIQVGNAGLVSGDLYIDTAANILANGDLVMGRKV